MSQDLNSHEHAVEGLQCVFAVSVALGRMRITAAMSIIVQHVSQGKTQHSVGFERDCFVSYMYYSLLTKVLKEKYIVFTHGCAEVCKCELVATRPADTRQNGDCL